MALLQDLCPLDNESWGRLQGTFAKPIKQFLPPQNVPSTSDRCLIELENQVQRLMEAHLAPNPPVQVNKIASSCKICNGPHGTQYCMENLEQAFFEYASSRSNEVGGKWFTFKPEQNNLGDTYNPSWKSRPNLILLEETDPVFGLADGTKSYPVGIVKNVEVYIGKLKLLEDFYVIDMEKDPENRYRRGKDSLAPLVA
ncbi:hypothetical protein Tco_1228615 [Tanacetum coccineum]